MTIYPFFSSWLVGMIEESTLEYCHKKIYEYSGTGKLSFEDGQEFGCEFVVFQLKDGEILFHANHCRAKIQTFSSPKNGHYHVSFMGLADTNCKISGENGIITNIESIL